VVALAGLAQRGRAIASRWLAKEPYSLELRLADAVFGLYDRAPTGAELLRRLSSKEADVAAMQAIAAVVRGDLGEALAIARTAGWFISDVKQTDAFVHVIWALAHSGRTVEALALLTQWRMSFVEAPPEARSTVLRAAAWIETTRLDFARAAMLLEEAVEVAEMPSIQRCYAEADLAYAYSVLGRGAEAAAIEARWQAEETPSPIAWYRGLSRAAIAIFREDFDAAFQTAIAVGREATRTGNASVVVHARFWEVLSAPRAEFSGSFAAFRAAVASLRSVLYGARLRVMELASEGGTRPLRECFVVERTASGERRLPFARLWAHDAEALAADLYLDTFQRRLHVRGAGPIEMDAESLHTRALETLLRAPGMSMPVEAYFEAVWGETFHRLRHSTKLHVAIHRLRALLHSAEGVRTDVVRVRAGRVSFAPELDVRILEPEAVRAGRQDDDGPRARVVHLLEAAGPLSAGQIGTQLGLGRTTTRELLAELVDDARIVRTGAARATRYAASIGRNA